MRWIMPVIGPCSSDLRSNSQGIYGGALNRKLQKEAKKLFKEGEYSEAAEMFEAAGDRARAMEAWARARKFDRAAETAIMLGRGDDAAGYYLRGGFYMELAEFYRTRKDHPQAARYFTLSGRHDLAAAEYEDLLKNYPQLEEIPGQKNQRSDAEIRDTRYAASAHSKSGNYRRAAVLYQRIGAFREAAENLLEEEDYRNAGEAFILAGLRDRAGAAFSDGALYMEAARCYEQDGSVLLAAECYEKAGEFIKAGDRYAKADKPFMASAAYTEGDDLDKAIKVLTNVSPASPRYLDAIAAVVDLSTCKRYLTPPALRLFENFIETQSRPEENQQHFDTLYSVARMMAKSEYQDEADALIERLRTIDPDRLQHHEEQFLSVLESGEHRIDIDEILQQDFEAQKRQQEYKERQEKLKIASQQTDPSLQGVTMNDENDDSTLAMEGKPVMPAETLSYSDIQAGKKFGDRYLLLEHIGTGGMGAVFKALDMELEEDIALKMLSPQLNLSAKAVQRFKQEIKLARQINHPSVIRIYDIGDQYGIKFISMEYFHGKQLKEMISEQGFFNLETGIDVLLEICNGLSAAHKLGIIHRDIKSQNLMISNEGVVKILDFGIAKSLDIPGLTVESAILGTPEYMSPEAIRQQPVDTRSDIYSLGIVMYEMFTGRLPFICENFLSVIHCHLHEEPPPPRQFNPTLPEDLVEVIMICLEKNPEDRYHSVAEMAAELKMIRASL